MEQGVIDGEGQRGCARVEEGGAVAFGVSARVWCRPLCLPLPSGHRKRVLPKGHPYSFVHSVLSRWLAYFTITFLPFTM